MERHLRSALLGGAALGFGLAGLVDVAVFHDILQWHHFVMADDPATMLRSDGWLMLGLLAVVLLATPLLWRAARGADAAEGARAARVAWGGGLSGAGAFNVGDVLIDHFLLGLHDANANATGLAPDLVWLAAAVALLLVGLLVVRNAAREPERAPTRRPARS